MQMGWDGINRRRFPRVNYKCLVTVRKKGDVQTFTTQTENICTGGVCVALKEKLLIFSHVELIITLCGGLPPLKCGGTVVWTVKRQDLKKPVCYDTGIEFTGITEEQRSMLYKIVDELVKKQDQADPANLLDRQRKNNI